MTDLQPLIDRLTANANKLLAGEDVDRLELVNAMTAAASELGRLRNYVAPGDGGTAG